MSAQTMLPECTNCEIADEWVGHVGVVRILATLSTRHQVPQDTVIQSSPVSIKTVLKNMNMR